MATDNNNKNLEFSHARHNRNEFRFALAYSKN